MTTSACDRASLVEASIDDRLGETEAASMQRHLKTCAECRELLGDLQAIRAALRSSSDEVAPLEHQRARLALLRSAATPAKRKRPIALLAAAALTIPLVAWAGATTYTALRASHDPPSVPAPPAAPTPVPLPTPEVSGADLPAPPVVAPTSAPISAPSPPIASPISPRPQASAKPSAVPAAASSSTASQDFARAMDAVARGDFGRGARELEGFVTAHPSDPRVDEALYLQAIALERAGRVDDARAVARRYVALYPNGPHRAQAQRLAGGAP